MPGFPQPRSELTVIPPAGEHGADVSRSVLVLYLDPSVPAGVSAPPQLQQVVRPADHLPLALAIRQTTLLEPVASSARLGLAEYWLDDLAPLLVQLPTTLREQLAVHSLAVAQMTRDA